MSAQLRQAIPRRLRQQIKRLVVSYRVLTGRMRVVPDFIIIGAQRAGTTSLYNYLIAHPSVVAPFMKEVHFFDVNFDKGLTWYRAHFPNYLHKYLVQVQRRRCVTGEASPYYLFHPHVPRRISEVLPQAKLIVLLRNPIDRAYSHYHHEVRSGREQRSFEAAIAQESEWLQDEIARMVADEHYQSHNHQCCTYVSRGIYIDQLQRWMNYFSQEQMLILKSEDVNKNSPAAMSRVLAFLDLPKWELKHYRKYHSYPYPTMEPNTRAYLTSYFAPFNRRLYEFLGADFGWDT